MKIEKIDSSSKIQIGIIEDNKEYADTLKELIDDHPQLHCIFRVSSAESAIRYLKNEYIPQILLLDIDLPGKSGIEAIADFKHISRSTQIIMLTIYDDDDKIFNSICMGAEAYILKSDPSTDITEAILHVYNGGSVMNPYVASRVLKMFNQSHSPKEDYGLTEKEKDVLEQFVEGKSKKVIADELFNSVRTIETHLKNIYLKLHVHTQVELVTKAIRERLI